MVAPLAPGPRPPDHRCRLTGGQAAARQPTSNLRVRYVSGQTRSPRASSPARVRGSVGASRVVARR